MKFRWLLVIISTFFVLPATQAETREAKANRHFALLDTDSNGLISRDEAAVHPPLMKHFSTMDKNRDGGISINELVSYKAPAQRNRHLAQADETAAKSEAQ